MATTALTYRDQPKPKAHNNGRLGRLARAGSGRGTVTIAKPIKSAENRGQGQGDQERTPKDGTERRDSREHRICKCFNRRSARPPFGVSRRPPSLRQWGGRFCHTYYAAVLVWEKCPGPCNVMTTISCTLHQCGYQSRWEGHAGRCGATHDKSAASRCPNQLAIPSILIVSRAIRPLFLLSHEVGECTRSLETVAAAAT